MINPVEWKNYRKQVINGGSYTFIVRSRRDPMLLQRKSRKKYAVKKIVFLSGAAVFSFLWILMGVSSVIWANNAVAEALKANATRNGIFHFVPWVNELTAMLLPLSLVLLAAHFAALGRINRWLKVYSKFRISQRYR